MFNRAMGKWLSWLATTTIFFGAGLLGISLLAHFRYGTWAAATHAWRGDALLLDRYEAAVDRSDRGQTIPFRLTNTSSQPVRFLGARSSCSCVIADGFPFEFAPGSSRTLEVRYRPKKTVTQAHESVFLYTDSPTQQIIPLIIML